MTDDLLRKKKILNIVAAFVAAGAVLLYSTVPVFASSQSVGSIDRTAIPNTDLEISLWIPNNQYIYVPEAATEFVVPVYAFIPLSDIYNYSYLSGMARYNCFITQFGYPSGTPVNIYYDYFESVERDDMFVIWGKNTNDNLKIYFNNYRFDGLKAEGFMLLGYMHMKCQSAQHTGFTLYFPNNTNKYGAAGHTNVYGTAYEYGFAEAMAYAIANATSTQEALDWLADISQTARYLEEEVYDILYTQYPLVLSALAQINNNVYAIYQQLLSMNAAQSSEAAAIEGEVNQKASQSAVLSNDMAVDKPQLSGDDINITGLIDTSVNQQFTGFLGALVNNQFITTMFLIALSCMIIGFVLYGKK